MLKLQAKGVAIWADEHHWTVHCVCSSEWSTFDLHLGIPYQCIWDWQHFQKPSPKCNFTFFLLFFSALGLDSLLTAGALTDLQLPATTSNVCTTDARLGGIGRVPPPPTNAYVASPSSACELGSDVLLSVSAVNNSRLAYQLSAEPAMALWWSTADGVSDPSTMRRSGFGSQLRPTANASRSGLVYGFRRAEKLGGSYPLQTQTVKPGPDKG